MEPDTKIWGIELCGGCVLGLGPMANDGCVNPCSLLMLLAPLSWFAPILEVGLDLACVKPHDSGLAKGAKPVGYP